MTRDEAIEIEFKSALAWALYTMDHADVRRAAAETIDGYVTLGMLKLDAPTAAPCAPAFHPGQTYLTQGGQAMRIERWSGADGRYATEQSRRPVWYREDGKCDVREWSHYDLLPGAVDLEREPR